MFVNVRIKFDILIYSDVVLNLGIMSFMI